MGAGTLWLLRKRRNQSFAPFVAAPVLLASAAAATLQLTVDDPVWFCWPSVVGWPLTIVNFVLFAACTVAQVYLLRQTFRACMAADRRNSFQPTFLLPALAACIFIACLLLYPIASAWADIRILQHLTYGIPLLLLVIYALYMAGKLLFGVRCSPVQKLAAIVAGVSAMVTLVVLGMMALSILFYIILVAASFLVLSGFHLKRQPHSPEATKPHATLPDGIRVHRARTDIQGRLIVEYNNFAGERDKHTPPEAAVINFQNKKTGNSWNYYNILFSTCPDRQPAG